ncbi:PspC domain-containing protein [Nocardiopsis potens]|uniref:PspC domain-containing protein n=1 Tax=Nocardiopsis potens TaxID=1246458 RepID=UPI000349B299|nr:PspC domain-containing protein [Nocardiopsis potens]
MRTVDEEPEAEEPEAGEGTLRRDRDAGVLTGVCTGLGRYTGTDPVVWRVAFALTGLAGGAGVLLYVGAWLTMRDADGGPAMFEQLLNRSIPPRAVPALLAVALAALTALSLVGGFGWGTLVLATPLILGLLSARNRGVNLQRLFRELPSLLKAHRPPPAAPAPEPKPAYYNPAQPWAQPPSGPIDLAVVAGRGGADAGGGGAPERGGEEDGEDEPGGDRSDGDGERTGHGGCGVPRPRAGRWARRRDRAERRARRDRGVRLLAFAFWAAVAAAGVAMIATGRYSADTLFGPETGPVYLGSVAVIIGAALLVGAWAGDPRGLVAAGVLAVALTAASSATDLTGLRFGRAEWHPRTAADLAGEEYRLTVGTADLDLTGMELDPGERVDVDADVRFGALDVFVPPQARVVVNGSAAVGEIRVGGWMRSGTRLQVANTFEPEAPAGGGKGGGAEPPTLVVNLTSYAGDLEVHRVAP